MALDEEDVVTAAVMTVPMTAAVDVVETEVIEVDFVVPWLRTLAPPSKEVEEAVDDVEDEL